MFKKLLLTGLLFVGGAAFAAARVEVNRLGQEMQSAVLEKGESATFEYADITVTFDVVNEDENGVSVSIVTSTEDAESVATEKVDWNKSINAAIPNADEVVSITFVQVKENE